MQAIRTIARPDERRQITVDLPVDFTADTVEVIVLPYQDTNFESSTPVSSLTEEQELLLSFPTATEEDLFFIDEKRRHLRQWK